MSPAMLTWGEGAPAQSGAQAFDFPAWIVEALDREGRLGVTRKPASAGQAVDRRATGASSVTVIAPGMTKPARSRYPASANSCASASSTDTSWLTPRSAIVTPNRRSIRAMVMGLWVMATKRVSARLRIASRRSQKRSTL